MKLDWRKAEFFGNVCVLDLQSIFNLQIRSSINEILHNSTFRTHFGLLCFLLSSNIPTSPSPTPLLKSWRQWPIRSQMFWILHPRFSHFHPPGSATNTASNTGISKPWQYRSFCRWPPAYLKFHNIATGWCTHQSSPHIPGVFVQRAHVSGVFIMVHNLRKRSQLSKNTFLCVVAVVAGLWDWTLLPLATRHKMSANSL